MDKQFSILVVKLSMIPANSSSCMSSRIAGPRYAGGGNLIALSCARLDEGDSIPGDVGMTGESGGGGRMTDWAEHNASSRRVN